MTNKRQPLVRKPLAIGLTLVLAAASASGAVAADSGTNTNPDARPNGTWLSLSGKVTNAQNKFFTLDYGKGTVRVEMDGWNWYGQNYSSLQGDKVTVYGRVDDDLFEKGTIEASSVYDEKLGTYFYANAADEEGPVSYAYWVHPIVVGETVVRGEVTSVDDRDFKVDYGPRQVTVDTSDLASNPLDDQGFQQIDKGDYVTVAGDMDPTFWGKKQLRADSVVTLVDD